MASQLSAVVDPRTCASIRVALPKSLAPLRPQLLVRDPATGTRLSAEAIADSLTAWQWRVPTGRNQVLLLSLDAAPTDLPLLVNCRALKILARELKRSGCDCHALVLEQLRLYHALSVLLFSQGNYASCQDHLTLLDDLAPEDCGC